MANYHIKHGLLKVLQLLVADPEHASHVLPVIHKWMEHMHQPQLDEGDVFLEISIDAHTGRELMIPGSPLHECRNYDTYRYWRALEGYTRDQHHLRFFDLCRVL